MCNERRKSRFGEIREVVMTLRRLADDLERGALSGVAVVAVGPLGMFNDDAPLTGCAAVDSESVDEIDRGLAMVRRDLGQLRPGLQLKAESPAWLN